MDPENQKQVKLTDIVVEDENVALNVLVNFISLAQKRGVYTIDESAKIWECIKIFQKLKG
jgi:hypothetical protein